MRFISLVLVMAVVGLASAEAQRPSGGSRPGGHSSYGGGHSSYGGGHSSYGGGRPSSSSYSRPSSSSRPSAPSYSRPSSSSSSHAPAKGGYGSSRPSGTYSRPSSSVGRPYSGSRPSSVGHSSAAGKGSRPSYGGATATRPSSYARYGERGVGPRPEGGVRHYGHVGRPGPMPPSHHAHVRPAPYFHHPVHGVMVHMHPIFWDPVPFHALYWPGFWHYCHGYWHDYHVSDIVVVREYVRDNYNTELVTYVMSDSLMYALTVGEDGDTFLQVFDKEDNLLAQQKVSSKYCIMEIDKQNGGCWIMKKESKDPLLFLYNDGELLIYEED